MARHARVVRQPARQGFRSTMTYVVVRPVRLSGSTRLEPGDVIEPGTLRRHHMRALHRRRRIGPQGHPWTDYMLAVRAAPSDPPTRPVVTDEAGDMFSVVFADDALGGEMIEGREAAEKRADEMAAERLAAQAEAAAAKQAQLDEEESQRQAAEDAERDGDDQADVDATNPESAGDEPASSGADEGDDTPGA